MVNQGGALLAALPPRSFLRSTVPCRGLPQRLPDSPIQCARRSCASDRGGGRFAGTPPGPPRSRDPRGAGCQSCPQAEGTRVEGQVSRPGAHHPTGGATRARVRVDEYPETPRGRDRSGSLLIGRVLRRMAGTCRGAIHAGARRPPAHLVGSRRLAPARPRRAG